MTNYNKRLDKILEEFVDGCDCRIDEEQAYLHLSEFAADEAKQAIRQLVAEQERVSYSKGYNDNARNCYCDSPGATEGVLAHKHLLTNEVSSDVRPDIPGLTKAKEQTNDQL